MFGWRSAVVVAGLLAATDPLFRVRLVLSNWFHLFIVWLLGWGYLSSFSPLLFVRACSPVCLRGVSVFVGFSHCPSIFTSGYYFVLELRLCLVTIFVPVYFGH